mmetsp:Transcript_2291/g.7033  ORF Transcript_2291/g.7033 Transcript_2291/m.7033 type:complete len:142 (+) Transcript_2291:2-427(+)
MLHAKREFASLRASEPASRGAKQVAVLLTEIANVEVTEIVRRSSTTDKVAIVNALMDQELARRHARTRLSRAHELARALNVNSVWAGRRLRHVKRAGLQIHRATRAAESLCPTALPATACVAWDVACIARAATSHGMLANL